MDVLDQETEQTRAAQQSQAFEKRAAVLHSTAQLYRAAFGTDEGKKVLADLARCYDGSTLGATDRDTITRSAQRDVLHRIRLMLDVAALAPGDAQNIVPDQYRILIDPWR